MVSVQLIVNIMAFAAAVYGILRRSKNLLIILMCVEVLLLVASFNLIGTSIILDDIQGQLLALFVLTVAAAESSIGIAILILHYRKHKSISLHLLRNIRN